MAQLKQSTAYTRMFKLVSSTDHITAKTGATPTVNLSKAGGAFGAAGGAVTEVANGWYKVALNTTDTNTLGDLAYYITASGADDTDFVDQVTGQILGDTLNANTTQFAGQTITCSGGVTIPAATLASTTNITTATGVTLNNGAQTITSLSITAGMTITQSGANTAGLSITGNGTGHGMIVTSGSGATGDGFRAVSASTNGNGITGVKTGTGNDFNCTSTPLVLAKTTNITGFNDIAATSIVSGGAITTSGGAVSTVTSITNGVTVTTNNDKTGYSLTGNQSIGSLTVSGGITVTQSTLNGHGISVTGNGTGHGILATSGSGATGDGLRATAASTNGSGITGVKTGTGSDLNCTSTPLVLAKTTNITGFNDIAATAIVSAGAITTNAGAVSNVTTVGSVTGSVGSVTGAVGSVTGAVGSVTGNVGGNVTGSIGSLAAQAQTDVKTQAVAALNTDTYAEPGQVTPSATTTLVDKIGHLYKNMRNKKTQTSGVFSLYNDAGTVVDQKTTVSDDGTTATKDKITTGP